MSFPKLKNLKFPLLFQKLPCQTSFPTPSWHKRFCVISSLGWKGGGWGRGMLTINFNQSQPYTMYSSKALRKGFNSTNNNELVCIYSLDEIQSFYDRKSQ